MSRNLVVVMAVRPVISLVLAQMLGTSLVEEVVGPFLQTLTAVSSAYTFSVAFFFETLWLLCFPKVVRQLTDENVVVRKRCLVASRELLAAP